MLTVVLPVLNNASGLRRALESVLSQTVEGELQLIVIDGGSVDGTLEVIHAFADRIDYWETGLDSGIADAFNRGIAQARGEIVGILNSDDQLLPGALAKVLDTARVEPAAEVFCGAICYMDPDRDYRYVRWPSLTELHRRMTLFHPALFVRRSTYARVGVYDPAYTQAMDAEWCHRALQAGCRFQMIPSVLAEMSLGGLSDRHFVRSLVQYRRSVLAHDLASTPVATFWFLLYLGRRLMMQIPLLHPVKRWRDQRLKAPPN